jgi:lactobin A/cerein 7B family class IIb bacteriocin
MKEEVKKMNNNFMEMTENDLMAVDGGLVIFGVTITAALLAKIGAGVIVVGGVGMFAKGCYDGYEGN